MSYEENSTRQQGAMAGLALCKGRDAHELLALFEEEGRALGRPGDKPHEQEWRRYRLAQIEWCLDCLAAADSLEGAKSFEWLSWHPSSAAVVMAQSVLGS